MLHALKQAFDADDVPEENEKLMTLCRGGIKEHYLRVSLQECNFVGVGYHANHIVAVILAYTHRKTNRTLCKPHELYLDRVIRGAAHPPRTWCVVTTVTGTVAPRRSAAS